MTGQLPPRVWIGGRRGGSIRVAGVSWHIPGVVGDPFLAERVGQGGRNGQGLGTVAVTASWFGLVVPGLPGKSVHIECATPSLPTAIPV